MNYQEAYSYINSFTNYERLPRERFAQEVQGLTRVDLLMRLLGNPQSSFKSIVVAGTKGKGSVSAMAESVLREAGLKTGLYTSPHLHTFRERIRVAGEMIAPSDMARYTGDLVPIVDRIRELGDPQLLPTTYELATAIAFLHFREQGVDIAVLEVGLGGRLDAVNIAKPEVSVITPISLDHMDVLGNTVGKIAAEKAGIIKFDSRVISAPQPEEAMAVIRAACTYTRATLSVVSNEVYISTDHLPEDVSDEDGVPIYQTFTVAFQEGGGGAGGRVRVKLPLLGSHQQLNAAVAIAVCRALAHSGIDVTREQIVRGLAQVVWPGRLEIVNRQPIVVADGAHNPDSMSKLMQAMNNLFYGRKMIVVLGVSSDKDIPGIVAELGKGPDNVLGPRVGKVIVTRSRHPRAADPNDVAAAARARGLFTETREESSEAIATAIEAARAGGSGGPDDPVVLVTGSLFVVAEAREAFGLAPDLSEEGG